MADKEEVEETGSRKNEWEVVSLSASAYAASPDPEIAGIKGDEAGGAYNADTEISRALFMSGHFVFPPSQHENLPLEPEAIDALEGDTVEGDAGEIVPEGSAARGQDDAGSSFGTSPIVYPKSHLLDDNDHRSTHAKDFEEGMNLDGLNPTEEMRAYGGYGISSLLGEAAPGGIKPDPGSDSASDMSKSSKQRKGDNYDSDIPSGAWWKKAAASWYTHVKEANTFWSVFIAAAVMGLVILGQSWQQERWKVLQVKWQMTVNNEKMGRMLAPIYRFKDALARSHRHGSLIRASSSSEN
ncbi:hypothetical protein MLD38_039017 [Melastoma candidum]|uniref:Uncharacterized protein n=1 Tax=Melastoma candidum TaxID=119954 RepID=A0ACB9L150_9MYRT|nr:hypothetical protein MLD38_039017 [Melastoma candidum]